MSEEQEALNVLIRPDQKQFLGAIAYKLNVSVAAVVRWTIDDARAQELARASITEADLSAIIAAMNAQRRPD